MHQIIAAFETRLDAIVARFKAGQGNSEKQLRLMFEALGHGASHYASLASSEREALLTKLLIVAATVRANLFKKKSPAKKKAPVAATEEAAQSKCPAAKAHPAPDSVLAFFGDANCLPRRPRAADDYTHGTRLHAWEVAATLRHLQLNPPAMVHWLIFDCDHTDVARWRQAGLPEPSFITVNPDNGHHHIVYKLAAPVCVSQRGRERPKQYLRSVREALRDALHGDPAYPALLTKNPLHSAWTVIRPAVMPSYTLAELAADLSLPAAGKAGPVKGVPHIDLTAITRGGRNRALFDALRSWAYMNSGCYDAILAQGLLLNDLFPDPLGVAEVQTIARSIARYVSNRVCRQHTPAFRSRQAARGRKGGRPCSQVQREPWIALGISRATWYRRQRAGQE